MIREEFDLIYLEENKNLEASRIKYLKNEKIYQEFIEITFSEREESQKSAVNIIEKRLNT